MRVTVGIGWVVGRVWVTGLNVSDFGGVVGDKGGDRVVDDVDGTRERGVLRGGVGGGRGKKNANGLKSNENGNLDRSGGRRTFKNMLYDRRALFACGTYLYLH